jgi:hypothetical protein
VTVSPIELRPQDILPVNLDRALAYFLMSVLFQYFSPTRHAHFTDASMAGNESNTAALDDLSVKRPGTRGGSILKLRYFGRPTLSGRSRYLSRVF